MLYVEGNVAPSAVQAINVNVLDIPKAKTVEVPVVQVTGTSTPDNFVAGDFIVGNVDFSQSNFLDLKVGVVQRPSSTGAQDMFALTLDFAGVNDTGALAASIVPGAHSLMASQVGTFRQRMGVFSQLGNSDKGAWVRVFGDKGSIDPDQLAGNLPTTDNFGFDQRNSGIEAGVNALVTDGVFVGASLATAKGKQDLSNGVGSDDIDGDTIGGYLTWLSPNGMYADVSYRWMHFDADMSSFGGQRKVGGDVSAFNVEAGWDVWTSTGGLKLVPQVQYTHQEVQNVDRIQGELADFFTDGGTSERGRLGLSFQQTLKTANGSWTPYGTVSVIREFDGDSHFAIADNAFNGGSTTKGTSGMLELGADVNMGALHVYGGLNWTDGGAIDSVWGGQVGVRYTW
jgi:outer membrane autotransporter protein